VIKGVTELSRFVSRPSDAQRRPRGCTLESLRRRTGGQLRCCTARTRSGIAGRSGRKSGSAPEGRALNFSRASRTFSSCDHSVTCPCPPQLQLTHPSSAMSRSPRARPNGTASRCAATRYSATCCASTPCASDPFWEPSPPSRRQRRCQNL
jgi:hypothetical protein